MDKSTQPIFGDPNCPHCGGIGYLRQDLPIDHPEFGRLQVCICRQGNISAQARDRLFSLSHLEELEHLTFENFKPDGRVGLGQQQKNSLQRAHNLARAFSETLDGWLLIQGKYGCGKTHLAAAIANDCVARGVPTLFLTVPDLLDSLRFAYSDDEVTFEERFDQIRDAQLLVLDDFGTQNATDWAREKLFQLLNYRYINKLPLVVTTNLSIDQIEGRMRSRLSDPDQVAHVQISAPDYRRPVDDTGPYELSTLHLHHQQTFGNFNLRKGEKLPASDVKTLEEAFQAAKGYADEPVGWLTILGPFGCGKTHLAAAIANYQDSQGFPVMFVVVPDMLDHLRATFNPDSPISYDRRFEEIRSAPLLILDDLGSQAMKPWVREKLYQLFNHRYQANLPTVITSAETLDEIDPRLRSRMLDRRLSLIKPITVPSYRGKSAKSRSKR